MLSSSPPAVRHMQPSDFAVLDTLLTRAYGRPGEWRWELEHFSPFYPRGWFVAEMDGVPAGTGGTTNYGPFAWIGLMGVDPTYQRRGVGAALLDAILAELERAGCTLAVLDASASGAPLYERYGFLDDGTTVLFKSPHAIQGAVSLDRVRAICPDDLKDLGEFDTPIFGADRTRLLRTLFDALPDRGFVARDRSGAISAYVLAQSDRIGPWMASSQADAEAVLRAALALPFEQPPSLRVPSHNSAACELLDHLGFVQQRALRHMYHGAGRARQNRGGIYGEASFSIG